MKNKYVVYKTFYYGKRLPKYYIGSTSEDKIKHGYFGTVKSKKWKGIFEEEVSKNHHLFKVKILSRHKTRKKAIEEEYRIQKKYNVVKSKDYFNEAYANVNGCHGRDVSGKNNPMFGRINEVIAINILNGEKVRVTKEEFLSNPNLKGHSYGFMSVLSKKSKKWIKVTQEEYYKNRKLYIHCNDNRKASKKTKIKLSEQRKEFSTVKDWEGKYHRVKTGDCRVKTGELANISCKKWTITYYGNKYHVMSLVVFCKNNGFKLRSLKTDKGYVPIVKDNLTNEMCKVEELKEVKNEIQTLFIPDRK